MKSKSVEFIVKPSDILNSEMLKIRGGISNAADGCQKTKNKCKDGDVKEKKQQLSALW